MGRAGVSASCRSRYPTPRATARFHTSITACRTRIFFTRTTERPTRHLGKTRGHSACSCRSPLAVRRVRICLDACSSDRRLRRRVVDLPMAQERPDSACHLGQRRHGRSRTLDQHLAKIPVSALRDPQESCSSPVLVWRGSSPNQAARSRPRLDVRSIPSAISPSHRQDCLPSLEGEDTVQKKI